MKVLDEMTVCSDCLMAVEYGDDAHDICQESRDAVRACREAHPGVDYRAACYGQCPGGFTRTPCDMCHVSGREDHRVAVLVPEGHDLLTP